MTQERPSIRWWPVGLIGLLTIVGVAYMQVTGISGEARFTNSANVVFVAIAALLAWVAAFSRARWWLRTGIVGAVALTVLGAFLALEVRGFSGNLVPILAWKWNPSEPGELDADGADREIVLSSPADYPQFLGPARNATLVRPELARDWQAEPPRELWRRAVGDGWSSFAVAGDLAVTQEQRGDEEIVVAYAVDSGEVRWSHRDRARHETPLGGAGPRATPTVDGQRVYTLGATGLLSALDLRNGTLLWARDIATENGASSPRWGYSGSPLIVGDKVVVSAGGPEGRSLLAYDASSGHLAWAAGDDRASYASPLLATLGGTLQIVIFNRSSVSAHDPDTGEVLWAHDWQGGYPNVSQPLPIGDDRLLISTGYGIGSALLHVRRVEGRFKAEVVWSSTRMKAKFTNLVLRYGYVYGLDDGVLVCLDPATGERRWKAGRYGHGQVLLVGRVLLVQAENGDVVLVEPTPDGHRELTRFSPLSGKTWNHPALAGRRLLVRNDREAAAYELPVVDPD